jgi:hypothetical protein
MIPLQLAIGGLSLLVALVLLVFMILDRRPNNVILSALAAIEVALVAQLVLGVIRAFGGAPDEVSLWEYVGYLIAVLLILPAGVVWSSAERTRSGTAVLLIAVLMIPFLALRINQIWPA